MKTNDIKLDEYAAFREEVRAFFATHLDDRLIQCAKRASGIMGDFTQTMRWQKILHEKGWAAPAWPAEYGGTGWNDMQRYIYASEYARAHAPRLAPLSLGMIGPTLIVCGTQAQKDYYLPRILSGEDFWCQGYSEPAAGSDLASLQMRAVKDGDDYILNGSKIWTSYAQHATMMFCLVRTDMDAKPQRGISFLLVDMRAPGIEIAPIITLAGDHEVNQVFFNDVRVPVENLVGAENDGWTVAKTLLVFERGGNNAARLGLKLDELAPLIEAQNDPSLTLRLNELSLKVQAIEMSELRMQAALAAGEDAGAASSQSKILGTETTQAIDMLTVEAVGQYGLPFLPHLREMSANDTPPGPAAFMPHTLMGVADYLNNRAASIYGGSNEVQRNIIAKHVLGL